MTHFKDPTPVIIWDIDDVWHPWYDLAHAAVLEFGLPLATLEKPTTWAVHEHYGITLEQWVEALIPATLDGTLYASTPSREDVDVFAELYGMGADHHFVTARGHFGEHRDKIRAMTRQWVNAHFQQFYASLSFSRDKSVEARMLRATHAIDDQPKNFTAMADVGVDVYLMDQPWNQDFEVPAGRRVHSIGEFADALKNGGTA